MTQLEQSHNNAIARATQERDALLNECRRLLIEVSKRPNSLKLLTGVRDQLRIFAQYKVGRRR